MRALRWPTVLLVGALTGACSSNGDDAPAAAAWAFEVGGPEAKVAFSLDPFVFRVTNARGVEVLRSLAGGGPEGTGGPGATRDDGVDGPTVLPGWDGFRPAERPWTHPSRAVVRARSDDGASFDLTTDGGVVTLDVLVEGPRLRIGLRAAPTDARADGAWNKVTIGYQLRPDEHFFGLGERLTSVDHRGLSLYSWAEEGGLGAGEGVPPGPSNPSPNGRSMTNFPVPFFFSSAGYAMHLATTRRSETHFGSESPEAFRVAADGTSLETVVYVGDDPRALLDAFTRDTGRPVQPPPWSFGPSRRVSLGDRVGDVETWRLLRARGVPTTMLDDAVHFLPARSERGREGELTAWTEAMHAAGYKVLAYNTPYVALDNANAAEDAAYGRERGLFVEDGAGAIARTGFISGELLELATIDLTIAEGSSWFQTLLERTVALGYDGWMHDFGEYVERPWRFGDGRDGAEVHNDFPRLSVRAAAELRARVAAQRELFFFARSGYTGTQAFAPGIWSGDPEASFDDTQGLPSQVRAGINMGLSGVAMWGSDVSGFKCITDDPHDKEMYLRWAEFGAVSPYMLEDNACANPIGGKSKWKLFDDDETVQVYGAMARLHTRLFPYFQASMDEATRTGLPIIRHPYLFHPTEPEAWATESSFYLGPSLYASPVVARGARTKEFWLPPGRWVDVEDFEVLEGGRRVTTGAPLAKLPLFLREGTMVPLLDASIETLVETASDPTVVTLSKVRDRLDVLVALGTETEARYVLSDGTTLTARRSVAAGPVTPAREVSASEVVSCAGDAAESGCFAREPGGAGAANRLRVTTPLAPSARLVIDDVEVIVDASPVPRRVRFTVALL